MRLTTEAFHRARKFVATCARPLEIARLRFHLGEGTADEVCEHLKTFQNNDGGFGNAIEPDVRAPESSALGTSIALQIGREISIDRTHPLVRSAIDYLVTTFDDSNTTWRIVPQSVEQSPHAPWWTQSDRFDAFSLNPTAELLGYLVDHREYVPSSLLDAVSEKVLQSIVSAESVEMHDLLCCKRLAETGGLDASYREQLLDALSPHVTKVSSDPADWANYSLRPLQVAESPQSPFFALLQSAIQGNLDYEITGQNPDGSWTPVWSWGDAYPEMWEKAKVEWAGMLTVDKLIILRDYGRIGGLV